MTTMMAGAATTCFAPDAIGEAKPGLSLASAAAHDGRFFGSAARIDHIRTITRLREIVLRDCDYLTPEFDMNWDHLHPAADRWAFERSDQLCAFATEHGMRIRGHLLLWAKSTPQWAKAEMLGPDGWRTVQNYLAQTLGHYNGIVDTWDVVNEAIDHNGRPDGLRENIFLRAFGPDYIQRAFEEARRNAPTAKLNINDYGFEYENSTEVARRSSFLKLLEYLRKVGAPVDGVGIQAHLDLSKGPINQRTIERFLQNIADMKYDIVITELDVLEKDVSAPIMLRDARVAAETQTYLDVALKQPAVKGVITWGLSDRFSWLQTPQQMANADRFPLGLNRGLPYDAAFDAKPMYDVLYSALRTIPVA